MENKTEGQRYLESFIQEVEDFKKLSEIGFFMKYCISGGEEEDIKELYKQYKKSDDSLTYGEWLEEVYYKETEDEVYDRILEYRQPDLDCIVYKDIYSGSDYMIYEVTLAIGGPNIFILLQSRWNRAEYQFYWGGETLEENLSFMYDDIFNYLNLDYYE